MEPDTPALRALVGSDLSFEVVRTERARSAEELYQKCCDAAVHGGELLSTAVLLFDPESGQAHVVACLPVLAS